MSTLATESSFRKKLALWQHKYLSQHKIAGYLWSIVRAVLIFGISFIILYPVLVNFSTSIMSSRDLADVLVRWVPRYVSWGQIAENYRVTFIAMNYWEALKNSLILALMVSGLTVASCTVVGYGFARFNFPLKNFWFLMVLLTLLTPPQTIMISLFLNFRFFDFFGLLKEPINLIGTYWPFGLQAATAVGLKNGLFIFIARQYFRGMPKQLEEAAYVDGAGALKTFFTVMLPGAGPILIIIFLFSFVWQWNDVFWTSLYMRPSQALMPFVLQSMRGLPWSMITPGYDVPWTVQENAGKLLFMAPLLIMYAFLQRYFIEGVERSGFIG